MAVFARTASSVNIVNESGFYALVLKSRKPEAVKFRDWVTGTVLPAIRKDGGYVLGEEKVKTGEMSLIPETAIVRFLERFDKCDG